jgi:hypothetical protein
MEHTANMQGPFEAGKRAERPPPRDDEDAHERLEPARLRAMLEEREAATARFRALKDRLLRR